MGNWPVPRIRGVCAGVLLLSIFAHTISAINPDTTRELPAEVVLRVRPDDAPTRKGFEHFYNTDYDAAIRYFEQAQKAHPDDPFAANHLLQAVVVRELDRGNAINAQLYLGTEFLQATKMSISPEARSRIQELTEHALSLSEQRLKTNPNDTDALYARGVTKALSATYAGLVEKAWFSALRGALNAFHDHQHVLELSPGDADAKLVVGVYNYVVAALPLYAKIAAFFLTMTGSKTIGIEATRQAANGGGEASIDAKTALSLFLAREHQYPEAISLMRELYRAYPGNFHFGLSEADLLRASGNLPEAVAADRKLLALGQQGMFPKAHLGQAAYALGQALRSQTEYRAAAEAFESADQMSKGDDEQAARAKLCAGKMYDLLQKRDLALTKYWEVIATDSDSSEAKEAHRLLKEPYRNP
jgi:tetratricopeptide (TPR) repeat protein